MSLAVYRELLSVVVAEFPLNADALTLSIPVHALLIAAELWVVTRQQHQAGEYAGAELLEEVGVAMVAVDLPMWRCWAQIHDSGMSTGRFDDCCCF